MENGAIVVARLTQFDKVFDRFRHILGVQLTIQVAKRGCYADVCLFLDECINNIAIVLI